jgi:cold shock CspA family protein
MLGKIARFGGFSKTKNRINNFGFITPLESDNREDIYLHRDDVPSNIQAVIEGQQGKGVYVEFDIDSTHNKVTNLHLVQCNRSQGVRIY